MAKEQSNYTDERVALVVISISAILAILGAAVFKSLAVTAVFGGITVLGLFFLVVAYEAR